MHLPDSSDPPVGCSGSAAETKIRYCRSFANGAFALTLIGSLSRRLDQGLLLHAVVETLTKDQQSFLSPLLLAVLQENFWHKCRTLVCSVSRNDAVLAVHQWLMLREGKNFVSP